MKIKFLTVEPDKVSDPFFREQFNDKLGLLKDIARVDGNTIEIKPKRENLIFGEDTLTRELEMEYTLGEHETIESNNRVTFSDKRHHILDRWRDNKVALYAAQYDSMKHLSYFAGRLGLKMEFED